MTREDEVTRVQQQTCVCGHPWTQHTAGVSLSPFAPLWCNTDACRCRDFRPREEKT